MSRTWSFTDVEFVALWEGVTDEALVAPLTFTSRTPRIDAYKREMHTVRARLSARLGPTFTPVMQTISRPDIRITAQGWNGAKPEDPTAIIRVLGARQGQQAYVVEQLPGETIWHSGGFRITECEVIGLAGAVVAYLPDTGAGQTEDVAITIPGGDGMDHRYGRSVATRSVEDTLSSVSDALLRKPVSRLGIIRVLQGRSIYGPRGLTEHTISWRDVIDDGRYAIGPGTPPVLRGVDARRLTEMTNVRVAEVVRAIKDETA
ncbi:ESX secretion-associated protein EspG [Nocardia callitridis]|uniref:ESX secretion-associated protein EspG n=1 Tax=Nocardia callitridis TaxID=648753 RepID=A0ABP9KC86_9NOCA